MEAARPGPSGARANKGGADKDEPPRVSPPVAFGIVEPRVYRSNVPTDASFEFLQGLGLKNALIMSPELPTRRLRSFFESNGVGVRHLGLEAWRPQDDDPDPLSAELLKEALEFVLDGGTHPLLILCSSGLHATGVLVGCLRRLQRWNLTSIFQEYQSFAAEKSRRSNTQFIESFDLDLVTLPPSLPQWFAEQQQMEMEDEAELRRLEEAGRVEESGVVRGEGTAAARYLFAASGGTLTSDAHFGQHKMV